MDASQIKAAAAALGGGGGMVIGGESKNSGTTEDMKQNLNKIIDSIEKTLGFLHLLYLNVSSFNAASQRPLLQRLNSVVMELNNINNMAKLSKNCNIQVPMEVLDLTDNGKSPKKFTTNVLNDCIAKNQTTKGKAGAFAESKRQAQTQSILPNGDVNIKSEL